PSRMRGTIMTVVLLGLPTGAILGGLLAAQMLPVIGWEGIYVVGGVVPLALLIVLFFILPESLQYLANDKKRDNTEKIRTLINRIVKQPIMNAATFTVPEPEVKSGIGSLFSAGLARNTIAIWTIYLFNWV